MSLDTNRLALETSPYLLQHAHNPVDWHPWGDEAFQKATIEDKPILLSVGYSACHWCHVMERESFENEAIAELMNRHFVSIKVDREERPDVDAIYMSAIQLMTGQGGWPMTVFLTPDGKPFYGGTYYPPEDRYGHRGFPRILEAVAAAWQTKRSELLEQGQSLLEHLVQGSDLGGAHSDTLLTEALLDNALKTITTQFDRTNGGFGAAPKFPQPANLDFLLRCHSRTRRQEPLTMVEQTAQKMALGGIYDQLGGGFHRYSTDAVWLAPHFEKMLYDNAQLAQIYARLWQATGNAFYRGIAEETLEYVLREMTGPEGEFYSAQDADSEGVEGKFFVWTASEVRAVLGDHDAAVFSAFFDVTASGNWESVNILRVVKDAPQVAKQFGIPIEETARVLDTARLTLLRTRDQRVKPGLDDKSLASWNGLMLAALAECAAVFDRDDFASAAIRNAEFLLARLAHTDAEGRLRLYRTFREGRSTLNGYLEDYAFVADGLLRLYEATGECDWIVKAEALCESMISLFLDEAGGGFFTTSADHERLIHRPKDWDDNAVPSGNSVAAEVLLRLADLRGNEDYRRLAENVVRKIAPVLERHPNGFGRMLSVLDQLILGATEVAIVGEMTTGDVGGDVSAGNTLAAYGGVLARTVFSRYLPTKIVVYGDERAENGDFLPVLADREARDGRPTAYVCRGSVCKEPTHLPEELAAQL